MANTASAASMNQRACMRPHHYYTGNAWSRRRPVVLVENLRLSAAALSRALVIRLAPGIGIDHRRACASSQASATWNGETPWRAADRACSVAIVGDAGLAAAAADRAVREVRRGSRRRTGRLTSPLLKSRRSNTLQRFCTLTIGATV
jgi:hypothetical protein